MTHTLRTISLSVAAVAAMAASAGAQDRLFVPAPDGSGPVEIGALGRFGQILGPAPSDAFDFPGKARLYSVSGQRVIDTATGAVLWTASPAETIARIAFTHDRTSVFVQTYEVAPPFIIIWRLRAIDASTGVPLAEVQDDYAGLTWDSVGRRLLAWSFARRSFDVFSEGLTPLGTVVVGTGSRCQAPTVLVSPHSGRAYVAYSDGTHDYGANLARLIAVDLAASRVVGSADLGNTGSPTCPPALQLWSAPPPPAGLAATVTGREVAVSWIPADYAAGYVLDAGGAPGVTAVTVFVGDTSTVRFANVPPGTYFLRVRAGNRMGGGRPSNEVRVVVP